MSAGRDEFLIELDMAKVIHQVQSAREHMYRTALIKLGWTPPPQPHQRVVILDKADVGVLREIAESSIRITASYSDINRADNRLWRRVGEALK